MESYIYI